MISGGGGDGGGVDDNDDDDDDDGGGELGRGGDVARVRRTALATIIPATIIPAATHRKNSRARDMAVPVSAQNTGVGSGVA